MTRERNSRIDLVCKIGGSLSRAEILGPLLKTLEAMRSEYRVLVVPGGGAFADSVRTEAATFRLGETASHWMAILAMDQYGYLLADLGQATRMVRTSKEIDEAVRDEALPILMPSTLLLAEDPLPHSWDVTSDTIAAHIAVRVKAELLVLLKDVDGVLTADPREQSGAVLIPHLSLSRLTRYGCVDAAFVQEAARLRRCWILNGQYPERLVTLLRSGKSVGTEIETASAAK
ncbi:MAG: delta 1-pyrroline-5-carboxylate synthetase [Candidatus Methylomirabilales bacterium]